jgi:hypothetical protein
LTELTAAMPDLAEVVEDGGYDYVCVARLLPRDARNLLLDEVLGAFERAGVTAFVSKGALFPTHTVGVRAEHRPAAIEAIAEHLPGPGRQLQESYPNVLDQPVTALTAASVRRIPERCKAIHVARYWSVAGGLLRYRMEYAVRIEFWEPSADDPERYEAPGPNAAATVAERDYFAPAAITIDGRDRPSIALFDRTFLPEVTFPVDVVYTWVDGADPGWRERFQQARAEAEGVSYHPEAQAANRYTSRDELRYSLRSLEMHAPWVRNVYLVTDHQVPAWLDPSATGITVVDHRDIFRDPSVLPVFNSSAIISQLHHIDGLAEHYLYLNDDMFFGADVTPEAFWHGSGIAKVFAARLTRPFTTPHHGDAPHFNISKNIRAALERDLGRSMSLAIRHTPYPQIRSVLYEIEEKYPEVVEGTAHRRFRHHDDIALDQFFHYYAQATGRAVADDISYDYVNVGTAAAAMVRLRRLLATREYQVFCLNDAPEPGSEPLPDADVQTFLDAYFPMPSRFEKA